LEIVYAWKTLSHQTIVIRTVWFYSSILIGEYNRLYSFSNRRNLFKSLLLNYSLGVYSRFYWFRNRNRTFYSLFFHRSLRKYNRFYWFRNRRSTFKNLLLNGFFNLFLCYILFRINLFCTLSLKGNFFVKSEHSNLFN
jgi:hypothetical protein